MNSSDYEKSRSIDQNTYSKHPGLFIIALVIVIASLLFIVI